MIATIPSIHPMVRRVLADDPDVRHLTRDRVYAGNYPNPLPALPAVRFRFGGGNPVAQPTAEWWAFTGSVVCHAETEADADLLSGAVLGALLGMEGTSHPEGVVQGVFGWGVLSAEDGEWTPPKPQRIVTVTLTARAV